MTILAVTFDGTRLNSSDANTDWGNFQPGTGGAPSSEGANAYQITTGAGANTGVVGRQSQSTTTRRGVDFNDPGTAVDFTAAANRMFYMKGYVTDAFDLNTTFGVELGIGSADTDFYHSYNMAGSGAALSVYSQYPAQGGYLITCIDPTIDTWADTADIGGAFDQTAVSWYGFGARMINGNSKSENVAFDALDYGTGLTVLSGTGADPAAKYTDFVEADQNLVTNRWGAAVGSGDNAVLRGVMTVGAAGTATEFDDSTSIVTFPDGYHSRGLFGVLMDIGNASSILADGALLIGAGTRNSVDANDTRPDYEVIGTSGAYTFTGQMRNFRDVTFTSVCDVTGADIECHLLTQGTAEIQNSTIRTNALTSIACLQDPTFGTTTDLHDTDFIQTGVGHAIELSSVGATYTFTNLTFSGYGANTTDDAALDITAASGTTTINYTGAVPTYKTAGATVVLVGNPIAVTVTVNDNNTAPLFGARVILETSSAAGDLPYLETPVSITRSGTTATADHTGHGIPDGKKAVIRGATDTLYNGVFVISVTDVDTYTYTMSGTPAATAAGTITISGVMLEGLTDSSGQITDSRTISLAQPLIGRVSSATGSPYFKDAPLSGTVSNSLGLSLSTQLILDE